MAKTKINCDMIMDVAYKARRQFTPKQIGERAKNLVSHSFNEFERLFKAKAVAYQDIFDYRSAIAQAHIAAEYYLSDQDAVR